MYLVSFFAGLFTLLAYHIFRNCKQRKYSMVSDPQRLHASEVERKSVDEDKNLVDLPDTKFESSGNIEPRSQSSQQCT